MGKIKSSNYIHPFIAILYRNKTIYKQGLEKCKNKFGPILEKSEEYNFSDITNYYDTEMGENLRKRLLVFKRPQKLEDFHTTKLWSNNLEQKLSENQNNRDINIDPGYLGLSKLVLFSTKNYAHRIYIKNGIYAEVTLIYEQGEFKIQSWTYPDYARTAHLNYLNTMRTKIKNRAREKDYMQNLD